MANISCFKIPFPKVVCKADVRLRPGEGEMFLFDSVCQEQVRIGGTPINYYKMDFGTTVVDPLYGEAINYRFAGPYRLHGLIQWADQSPSPGDSGKETTWEGGEIWFARRDLELANIGPPNVGDIVQAWDIEYWNKYNASPYPESDYSGYFFNIVDADENNMIMDGPGFAGYHCILQRNGEFTPERRVRNT